MITVTISVASILPEIGDVEDLGRLPCYTAARVGERAVQAVRAALAPRWPGAEVDWTWEGYTEIKVDDDAIYEDVRDVVMRALEGLVREGRP